MDWSGRQRALHWVLAWGVVAGAASDALADNTVAVNTVAVNTVPGAARELPASVIERPRAAAALSAEPLPAPAPSAPARVRIKDVAVGELEVGSASGVSLLPLPSGLKMVSGQPTVELKPGAQVVVRKREQPEAVVPLSTQKHSLPATVLVGSTGAARQTITTQLQPFIVADLLPLHWEEALAGYVTNLLVGLDADGPGEVPALESVFQITGRNLSQIDPSQVTVHQAGPAGYQRIKLVTRGIAPVEITAHSAYGDLRLSADIDPAPVRLEFSATNPSVDGLGIGATTITVTRKAANGALLTENGPLPVSLYASKGQLAAPSVEIPSGQASAVVLLTSAGLGEARVTEAGSADRGALVRFSFPWWKLVLGFSGAFAAGALRARRSKARRSYVVAGCVAAGLLVDILLALGAPIAPTWALDIIRRELAWLALGFVGGWPGTALLEKLAQRWFGDAKA